MFGEGYFHARSGLAHLAARVLELADKTESDSSPLTSEDIAQGLESPYLFVVCGEEGVGKSSFLNGIFGQEVCQRHSGLDSQRVQWFRYGEPSRDQEITPLVEECYRPVGFLKQFNLMDTPGTNASVQGHLPIIKRFLPASDLVFWVIPVGNPWGASLWDFISSQSDAILKKSVIVLQQTDLRDESDLDIILGHVRDLSKQRLTHVPPIFPVSAKLTMESKLSNPVNEALWNQSGYPALEQYVSDAVAHSPARQKMLVDIRKALADVLRHIEKSIEQRTQSLEGNEAFLRGLEAELDSERMKYSAEFAVKFADMRDVFASKNKEMKRYVRRKLGFFSSLKSLLIAENTSKSIESSLVDSVEASVVAQANIDGTHLVNACHQHWSTVRPRVNKRFSIDLDDFDDESDGFDTIRASFNKRMGRSARQAMSNLRIRKGINPQIIARQNHLKHWLYLSLVFWLFAGVTGALQVAPDYYVALGFLACAMGVLLIFIIRVRLTGKKITKALGRRLESSRISVARTLELDYKEGVRSFYTEYGNLLSGVRQHIFNAQQELEPNREQRNQLFLELMIIERDH